MNPKVSVIIPTYNTEKYLKDCIMSVINQSFQDFEIIVVDDGSTDKTQELIKKLQIQYPYRIKNILKGNGGTASALNVGAQYAKGKYLKWLSADDLLYPNALSMMLSWIEHRADNTDKILFYTDYDCINEDGSIIGEFNEPDRLKMTKDQRGAELFLNFYGNGSTSIFTKHTFEIVGGFDESIPYNEDYEFWLRWVLRFGFDIEQIPMKTAQYRIHGNSLTSTKNYTENKILVEAFRAKYWDELNNYQKNYVNEKRKAISLKKKIIKKMPPKLIEFGLKWKKRKLP